jgi:hypothetical protein
MEIGKPGSEDLISLLKKIDEQGMKLPEFQRDFRWDISNLSELIQSLMRGFPAGVMLFWDVQGNEQIDERPFEGSGKNLRNKTKWLVLDGQQRLTSLYQLYYLDYVTLKGNRKRKFFLDLKSVEENRFEDSIKYFTEREVNKLKLRDLNVQTERNLLPFNIIISEEALTAWKNLYSKKRILNSNPPERTSELLLEEISKFEKNFQHRGKPIDNLLKYKYHYVELPPELTMEAVATIFEKLNTTGQPLNIFEILTAKFYKRINLREKWKNAKEESPLLNSFSKDEKDTSIPVLILKTILLKKSITESDQSALECKRKNLLEDLSDDDIRKYWDQMVIALNRALIKISEQFGVPSLEYLPYSTILVPFTVILDYIQTKVPFVDRAQSLKKLSSWYWTSILSSRYDSSTDTASKSDVSSVISWINGSLAPEHVISFDPNNLEFGEITSGAESTAILNIQLLNEAKDFLTNESIREVIKNSPSEIDKHHFFPVEYIRNHFGESSLEFTKKDSILNIVLLRKETNRDLIKDSAPSTYISGISRKNKQCLTSIESHLISPEKLRDDAYLDFIDERKKMILSKIRDLI